MTIFFPFSQDRLPPGSFIQPVIPPDQTPGQEKLVRVCFNEKWLAYVIGCLFQLTMNTTWNVGTQAELQAAIQAANDLILLFQQAQACTPDLTGSAGAEVENMIRQDPSNPCLLQTSIDGINWCTFADLSKCFNPSQTFQGGAGSEQPAPGGGCVTYQFNLQAAGTYLLPTVVNSGDVITLVSAQGATNDVTQGATWYCPDGSIFIAGNCVGGPNFNGSAQLPSAPFMSPVLEINGTDYDLSSPVTVPGGVTNGLAQVQLNFISGDDLAGSVNLQVQVCNNVPPSWSHVLNVSLDPSGWTIRDAGAWGSGVGFQSGLVIYSGDHRFETIDIQFLNSTAFTLTRFVWFANSTLGVNADKVHLGVNTPGNYIFSPNIVAGNALYDTGVISQTGVTNLYIDHVLGNEVGANPGGSGIITSIQIDGTGFDPFA